jgi:hypothetical protein
MTTRLSDVPSVPSESPRLFYVTYGCGSLLGSCYSTLLAHSWDEARTKAFAVTKGQHAFMYSTREWADKDGETQAERYNLREVPLQPQRRITPFNRKYLP